jgi:hypothetical protein
LLFDPFIVRYRCPCCFRYFWTKDAISTWWRCSRP